MNHIFFVFALALALAAACGDDERASPPKRTAQPDVPSERRQPSTAERILILDAALEKQREDLARLRSTGGSPGEIASVEGKIEALEHTLAQERNELRQIERGAP